MPFFLLSPAKALDETPLPPHLSSFSPPSPKAKTTTTTPTPTTTTTPTTTPTTTTTPRFQTTTEELVEELKQKSVSQLQTLLGVSPSLASLNHKRYQNWDQQQEKCALLLFNGDAYQAMQPWDLSPQQITWSGHHLRILSGLYGLLSPVDLMKPYRLDMSKKLMNSKGMDVFWRETVSKALKEELEREFENKEERFIVNCASQEYFKAIDEKILGYPVITINFPGPAIFAKRGRGAFVRFGVQERVTRLEDLERFEGNNGEYSLSATTKNNNNKKTNSYSLTFTRDASKTAKITKKLSKTAKAPPKTTKTSTKTTKARETTTTENTTAAKTTTKSTPATTTTKSTTKSTPATTTRRTTRSATRKRKEEESEKEERGKKQPTKRAKK